jgi:enoyl-CoA hydratase
MNDTVDDVCVVRRDGHVLVVTLNRPAQRNALNAELRARLRTAFDLLDEDPGLRCAVLTGAGPAFCAGGDMKEMAASAMQLPAGEWGLLLGSRGEVRKPVIAAVNGFALAGGFRLAQLCDLCVAADTAVFGITEVKRGRGAPWAAPLIDMVPQRIMMELLITGESISAARAYEIGLVNKVVPAEGLLETALALAHRIASNAPLSVQAAKQMVKVSTEVGASEAILAAEAIYRPVYLISGSRTRAPFVRRLAADDPRQNFTLCWRQSWRRDFKQDMVRFVDGAIGAPLEDRGNMSSSLKLRTPGVWALGVLTFAALTACGSGGTSATSASSAGSSSSATSASAVGSSSSASPASSAGAGLDTGAGTIQPKPIKNVAMLLNYNDSATFSRSMISAAKATAAKAGINLDVKFANLEPATELANYQDAMTSGKYQGIVIQAIAGQLCDLVKKDAITYNMPVVAMVSPLCSNAADHGEGQWSPGSLAYVGGMNDRDHTVSLLTSATANTPGPQKVMLVVGTDTHPNTLSFIGGFEDFVKSHPDWKLVDTVYTNFSPQDAFAKTQNALQGHKDTTMILTSYAGITNGVVQAVEAQGLTGKIAIYDQTGGSAESKKLIENGGITGTLPSYPESMATAALQAVIDAGKGTQPKRFISDDGNPDAVTGAVTKSNISSFTPQFE